MFMPHWPPNYSASGQINKILSLLDNPEQNLPPIIHVTGTNGKGSVISLLKHILIEHGLTTHVFTSPHLLKFNENFTIANQIISDAMIYDLTEEIRLKLNHPPKPIQPSFFEYQTALAFLAFSKNKADICLIECGMGAKNDPTNILSNKLLSIITPITFDHEEHLGNSLTSIAEHKAHIMHESKLNIIAPQTSMVKKLLNNFNENNTINYETEYDFDIVDNKLAYIDIIKEDISYYDLPNLQGDHQIINLVTALTALKHLPLLQPETTKINQGIKNTSWIGRIENLTHIASDIIPHKSEIWFDGAHNEAGALALSSWLKDQPSNKQNLIIYGRSENKNHHQFLQYFNNHQNKIIFIPVKNELLSETKFNFQKFLTNNHQYNIEIFDDLESIILEYIQHLQHPIRIIICGSLYLYRDLHQIFGRY